MWTLCSAVQRFIFTHLDFFLSDKISSTNPRVIEDQRARQLCIDVRHSLFYETCATYGFNVDRVFAEGEFHHSSIRIVWLNMRNHYYSVIDYCWQLVDWSSFNGLCFFFSSRSEDYNSEEAGGASGLQVSSKLSQSLRRLHTWISIVPQPGKHVLTGVAQYFFLFIRHTEADRLQTKIHRPKNKNSKKQAKKT